MRDSRCRFLLVAALLPAGSLAAQSAAAPQRAAAVQTAAATITKQDVARHIGVIADDSMMGRDTPSPGLEMTARYVAEQFKKFGLQPAGDSGGWLQRYLIEMKVDFSRSQVVFAAAGKEASASLLTAACLGTPRRVPATSEKAGVVLVTGRLTPQTLAPVSVKDRMILYVPPLGQNSTSSMRQLTKKLDELFPVRKGLLILSDLDSASYASHLSSERKRNVKMQNMVKAGSVWRVHVRPESVNGLASVLAAAGVDLAQARADTAPAIRELPALTIAVDVHGERTEVPNTVGILEGSDPKLKHEYIVFSAHMDHIGIRSGLADSIHNGADDDASGTAGIVELAEAFSRPGARPKRSMIFLTVSGEEKGLLGSHYFASHPPVPLKQVVANVNFDMIGRWPTDTMMVIGLDHSDLGATFAKVNAAHLDVLVVPVPNPPAIRMRSSDHFAFASRGVPIIKFGGPGPGNNDYHQPSDSPDKVEFEREARLLRFAFYFGQEVANAEARPQWNPESHKMFVKE